MPVDTVIQLVTDLGSFGFIIWLVHRTQTHTIPRLASSFEKSVEKQRQDFKEMLHQQREDHERMIKREQEVHAEQVDKIVRAIEQFNNDFRIYRKVGQ